MDLYKERKNIRELINESKINYLNFFGLNWSKNNQFNDSNIELGGYSIWISEISDSNVIKNEWEELGIFCFEIPALHVK